MLKIDRGKQSFSLLDTPTLADVSITERYDLQEFSSNSPDAFFKEISQELFLLGKEGWAESCRMDEQRLERMNRAIQIAGPASVLADGVASIG